MRSESADETRMLVREIGDLVRRDRIPRIVQNCFDELASRADLTSHSAALEAVIKKRLGLTIWNDSWLVTRRGLLKLRSAQSALGVMGAHAVSQMVSGLGPNIGKARDVVSGLNRSSPPGRRQPVRTARDSRGSRRGVQKRSSRRVLPPDLRADVHGNDHVEVQMRSSRIGGSSGRSKSRSDPRWRPAWWSKHRDWSSENGFELEALDPEQLEESTAYHAQVIALLVSDEQLMASHWRTSFKKVSGTRLTDVARLEVHTHILVGLLDAINDELAGSTSVSGAYERLVKQAFVLGLADHVIDMALRMSVFRPATITLGRGLRAAATVGPNLPLDEVFAVHQQFDDHAAALGMFTGGVAKATQVLAVTHWDLFSRAVAKALRYRIPIVLLDDFLGAGIRDEIEARIVEFPALRAAACGRCGTIHTVNGRRSHRTDAICAACR